MDSINFYTKIILDLEKRFADERCVEGKKTINRCFKFNEDVSFEGDENFPAYDVNVEGDLSSFCYSDLKDLKLKLQVFTKKASQLFSKGTKITYRYDWAVPDDDSGDDDLLNRFLRSESNLLQTYKYNFAGSTFNGSRKVLRANGTFRKFLNTLNPSKMMSEGYYTRKSLKLFLKKKGAIGKQIGNPTDFSKRRTNAYELSTAFRKVLGVNSDLADAVINSQLKDLSETPDSLKDVTLRVLKSTKPKVPRFIMEKSENYADRFFKVTKEYKGKLGLFEEQDGFVVSFNVDTILTVYEELGSLLGEAKEASRQKSNEKYQEARAKRFSGYSEARK